MADVRWIKIYTDMISNKKIKRIRRLPEGNNIVLIWVFLLAQAGESNKSGALYLTDVLPFRAEDLAIEFDFEVTVINLALITLERFSMIEVFDEIIYIKNWNEYQNIEGMDKIREQTRLRNVKYREKQKQLSLNDVSVTSRDATEVEVELDLELEKEKQNTTTTEFSPFIVLEKEYCKLHRKLDIHLKPKEIMEMERLISGGVPLEFIVTNMQQMYQKKTEAGERVTSFSYYSDAINDSWNNRNVMQFQTKKKDRFNDILDNWGEKKKNESTRND